MNIRLSTIKLISIFQRVAISSIHLKCEGGGNEEERREKRGRGRERERTVDALQNTLISYGFQAAPSSV